MVFLNAWNRQSSGIPDQTYTFESLRADRGLLTSVTAMTAMLAGSDAAELERLVTTL